MSEHPKMRPIPIAAAKQIAKQYGYDQVVIMARRCHTTPEPHGEHITTYGRNTEHCRVAALMGDKLKEIAQWTGIDDTATLLAEMELTIESQAAEILALQEALTER
jgi:hypothetical protein